MSSLMSQNLQDKLGLTCTIASTPCDSWDSFNHLMQLEINQNGNVSIVDIYGDPCDSNTLLFEYENEFGLGDWEKWQFELWVKRNIDELLYNWENVSNSDIFYSNLI